MSAALVKGAVIGAVTASVVMISATAMAGTGIGAVFNLGKTNTVNARSILAGKTSKPELSVSNKGTGPALRLNAKSGHAPLSVSNKVMVPHLNANYVGGKSAASLVSKCRPGSLAAVAVFYAPQVPPDPTYVTPNRYGGEGGFACNGSQPELTKEGTGSFRLKIAKALPPSYDYVLFVNADSRGSTPMYADGNSEFAGPVWDIHVFDKTGTPVNPYYLDVQLVAD
jgi:hypothetical protein